MTQKPISLVVSDSEVEGYSFGLHEGATRDVYVARGIRDLLKMMSEPAVDQAVVYFGLPHDLTGGGQYAVGFRREKPEAGLTMVTCGCDEERKAPIVDNLSARVRAKRCEESEGRSLGEVVADLLGGGRK